MIFFKKNMKSIKHILFLFTFLIIIIPFLALSFILYTASYSALEDTLTNSLVESTHSLNKTIEHHFYNLDTRLAQITKNSSIQQLVSRDTSGLSASQKFNLYNDFKKISAKCFYDLPSFYNLSLIGVNGSAYNTHSNQLLYAPLLETWHASTLNANGQLHLIGNYSIDDSTNIFIFSKTILDLQVFKPLGMVYLSYPTKYLFEKIIGIPYIEGSVTYLLDSKKHIIFDSSTYNTSELTQNFIANFSYSNYEFTHSITSENVKYLMIHSPINMYGYRLVRIFPFTNYMAPLDRLYRIFLIILFTIILSFAVFSLCIQHYLVKPIIVITKLFNPSNLPTTSSTSPLPSEFQQIKLGINYILNHETLLKEQVDQLHQANKKITLEKLQAQINPHFLYNTLTSIKFTALSESAPKSATLITSLIKLLRLCLNKQGTWVTVSEEIACVKYYTCIQNIIYKDQISFVFSLDDALNHYLVPNFLLQPLVENSIFHGINPNKQGGYIEIKNYHLESMLIFEIIDNGVGFDYYTSIYSLPSSKHFKQSFSSLGLKNIDQKIKLLCGNAYGISHFKTEPNYTVVQIKLPLINTSLEERKL